jgi:predicted RNase H-like HicB family nuclease
MSQAFAVVIEETDHNFSAYVPDPPGCGVATGPTRDDVLAEIRDAIAFHLEGLAADAQPQPPVRSSVATVLV